MPALGGYLHQHHPSLRRLGLQLVMAMGCRKNVGFKTKHVMGILGDRYIYIYRYDMILQYVVFLFLIFFDITLSDVSDIIPGHEVK